MSEPWQTPKALEDLVVYLEDQITSGRVTEIDLTDELMGLIAEARRMLVLPSATARDYSNPARFRVSIDDHHAEIMLDRHAPEACNKGMIELAFAEVIRRSQKAEADRFHAAATARGYVVGPKGLFGPGTPEQFNKAIERPTPCKACGGARNWNGDKDPFCPACLIKAPASKWPENVVFTMAQVRPFSMLLAEYQSAHGEASGHDDEGCDLCLRYDDLDWNLFLPPSDEPGVLAIKAKLFPEMGSEPPGKMVE